MSPSALALTAFAFLLVATPDLVAPGRAIAVACGDALTESVILDVDLNCLGNSGLIVFAHDITIDLAGHRITGSAGDGINNGLAFNRLTVKNGAIAGFDVGIFIDGGEGHSIRGMDVRGGIHAIQLGAGTRFSKIQKSVISNTIGFLMSIAGDDNVVSQVVVLNCGGHGIQISGNRNTVTKTTIAHTSGHGISTFGTVSDNVFTRNTLSSNDESCISLSAGGGTGNQVTKNLCEGHDKDGISLVGADAGIVAGNSVIGNGANGIRIGEDSDGNHVTKNTVTAHGGSGIFVTADSDNTVITGNTTSRNRASGIDSDGPNATIGKNTADANRARGIEAPIGIVDAGGNKARHNILEECSAGAVVCK